MTAENATSRAVSERERLTVRSEKRQLTKLIGVRIDQAQDARYTATAQRLGMTVQELMRMCTDHMLDMDDFHRTPQEIS